MLIKQWGLFLFSLQISNSLNWDVSLKLRFYDFLFCVNMCTSTLKVFHQATLKHQPHLSSTHPVPTTHTVYIPAGLSCTSKKWSPTASVFNRLFESVDVSNKKSFLNTTMHFSLKCTGLCVTYLSRAGLWRHSYECSAGTERVIKQHSPSWLVCTKRKSPVLPVTFAQTLWYDIDWSCSEKRLVLTYLWLFIS